MNGFDKDYILIQKETARDPDSIKIIDFSICIRLVFVFLFGLSVCVCLSVWKRGVEREREGWGGEGEREKGGGERERVTGLCVLFSVVQVMRSTSLPTGQSKTTTLLSSMRHGQ